MTEEFCRDHTWVVNTLGKLDKGQDYIKETLSGIRETLTGIAEKQTNGKVSAAVERTKSGLLYYVIGLVAIAFFSAISAIAVKAICK